MHRAGAASGRLVVKGDLKVNANIVKKWWTAPPLKFTRVANHHGSHDPPRDRPRGNGTWRLPDDGGARIAGEGPTGPLAYISARTTRRPKSIYD